MPKNMTIDAMSRATVAEVAAMVRRFGMVWIVFQPTDGIMMAEGNGRVLWTTLVRPGVLLVIFRNVGPKANIPKNELYIATPKADMMEFGILPEYRHLNIPSYKMGTEKDVYETMDLLDPTGRAALRIKDNRNLELCPNYMFGFSDLIPLAAPMLRQYGSTIIRVPTPSQYCAGLTCHKEGFIVFHHRLLGLKDEGKLTPMMTWALMRYERLENHFSEWEDDVEANAQINDRKIDFLDAVHKCWDEATAYLVELEEATDLRYTDLMASHIFHAVHYPIDAINNIQDSDKTTGNHRGLRDWMVKGAHMSWDYLPKVVADMKEKGSMAEELIQEAWVVMIFRAFCWWRCHYMVEGQDMPEAPIRIDASLWDSEIELWFGEWRWMDVLRAKGEGGDLGEWELY